MFVMQLSYFDILKSFNSCKRARVEHPSPRAGDGQSRNSFISDYQGHISAEWLQQMCKIE